MSINNVTIVGRLTKDPELRYTPSGVATASFTVAVNRQFSNQSGEREADFIPVVVWRKAAENCANFLKKGSLAGVVGRIQTRNYEGQDGKRVYITEVVAESVQFLEPRNGGNPSGNEDTRQSNGNPNTNPARQQNSGYTRVDDDPFSGNGQIDISSDDLPF